MTTESPHTHNMTGTRKRRLNMAAATVAVAALSFAAGGLTFTHAGVPKAVPKQTFTASQFLPEGFQTIAAVTDRSPAGPPRLLEQGMPFSFADLVEHVSPAVVVVSVERETNGPGGQNLDDIPAPFRDFFRQFGQGRGGQGGGGQGGGGQGGNQNQQRQQQQPPRTFRSQAMGAGFIIDPSGYIVTNNHVIEDGRRVSVKLPSGREYQARVVGADKDTDVALLKVDGVRDLPTVEFGDDRRLRVGDWVVAVGNPFGLGGTVTAGIVSSIGRDIGSSQYTDYIQIDAPINQGNSGGPTFDLSGRVIGMNTAIFSPSGGSVGIGFALPASTVKAIVDQLRDHGNVARGWLGVQIQSLTPEMAASLGAGDAKGAIVANVIDGSPAQKAGFVQGDVILALNGSEVDDSRDLTRKVAGLRAGERAEFNVMRDGKKQNVTALIAKRDEQQLASVTPTPNRQGNTPAPPRVTSSLGMELLPLTNDTRAQYNLSNDVTGAVIGAVDQNSEAAEKGLRPGDVIMSVGNKAVRTPADVEAGIADAKKAGRDSVLLLVGGDRGQVYVALKIGQS